ncbi:MAG: glycosyltransferase [Candidatus Omnitrophota bacterium]
MDYDVSIIIACYNEEQILKQHVKEIQAVMNKNNYSYELIFVDDASEDKTRDVILDISKNNQNTRYFFSAENIGRGGSIVEGIKMAKGKIAGFLDIDLEIQANYIPAMVEAVNAGYDIATARRFYQMTLKPTAIIRYILSISYQQLRRCFLNVPLKDTEAGFKFFNREKILPLIEKTKNKGWFWDTEIMAISYYSGLKIKEIPCLFIKNHNIKSKVRIFSSSLNYFIELCKFKKSLMLGENKGIIYWNPTIYRFFMQLLYGKNFYARYKAIAEYIPEHSSVIDVCCGDGYLYYDFLKPKNIEYTGLDINVAFILDAQSKKVNVRLFDVKSDPLPKAEYIVMQASLCQFIPDQNIILEKLLNSATKAVIISEPIQNLSNSRNPIISFMVRKLAKLTTGSTVERFNEKSLEELFNKHNSLLKARFKIPGGREMIGVFERK